jgi:hypothetical protein
VDPFVVINGEQIWVERIMEEAGYVQGDDAGMKERAILHRDENYMNFASDNLKWVKKKDPCYDYYMNVLKEVKEEREMMLNGGK